MSDEAAPSTRKVPIGGYIKRQRWRERALYTVVVLLLCSVLGMAYALNQTQQATQDDKLHRSDAEMIAGGKRFIDAFYSLNAPTIEHDQFRAINMMATKALRQKRLDYLTRTDLVRKVRDANTRSQVRWKGAKHEILGKEGDTLRVEYQARLVIDQSEVHPLNIVLKLKPTPKTDQNTEGVAVLSWTDVAEQPFIKDEGDKG